jgi:hypothetical protein
MILIAGEEIDAELAGVLVVVPKARKTMRCLTGNEAGHTVRTCLHSLPSETCRVEKIMPRGCAVRAKEVCAGKIRSIRSR